MKPMKIVVLIILSLIGYQIMRISENASGPLPEQALMTIKTNRAESRLDFETLNPKGVPSTYTIYYNDKIYKTYIETEENWSILYDYSFQDTTKVTLRASVPNHKTYEKSILVVIDPQEYDFTKNELDIYYAGSWPISLEAIAAFKERLISIDLVDTQGARMARTLSKRHRKK